MLKKWNRNQPPLLSRAVLSSRDDTCQNHATAAVKEGFRDNQISASAWWMERVYWGTFTQSPQHFSLSLTHAVVMLFFFLNRCEATIVLIFSTVRRYSAHKHTLVPITASIKDESYQWGGNPFLRYCHPQCHWINGHVVHLSQNTTYPHTWRQSPTTIQFTIQRCSQIEF